MVRLYLYYIIMFLQTKIWINMCQRNLCRIYSDITIIATGTHVAIKAPGAAEEAAYLNRKRYHSLNVQVVCDSSGMIISFSARFPGIYLFIYFFVVQRIEVYHILGCFFSYD